MVDDLNHRRLVYGENAAKASLRHRAVAFERTKKAELTSHDCLGIQDIFRQAVNLLRTPSKQETRSVL